MRGGDGGDVRKEDGTCVMCGEEPIILYSKNKLNLRPSFIIFEMSLSMERVSMTAKGLSPVHPHIRKNLEMDACHTSTGI